MTYTAKARELRRCKQIRADGEPCRAWAVWGDPLGRCAGHAYKTRAGQDIRRPRIDAYKTRHPPCKCAAYRWPHRPGGGLCRWPDEPVYACTIPPGTRAWWRKRGGNPWKVRT